MAGPLGPDLNWTLASLPDNYRQSQDRATTQDAMAQYQQTGDPRALIQSGNMTLANLGMNALHQQQTAQRQAQQDQLQRERYVIDDARTSRRDAQTERYQNAQIGISNRNADNNEDYTPEELNARRLTQLRAAGIDPMSQRGKSYLLNGTDSGDPEAVGGKAGLSPVWGVKDGKPVMMQMHPSGRAVETQIPSGVSLARDPIRIDRGTTIDLIDPVTKELIRTVPKDVAGTEREKVLGEETGKGQVALPQAMSSGQQILGVIDGIQNHPGKQYSLGMYSKLPTIPGTAQADFRARMDQLKGQTFLQAYGQLKGGGAITDIEGTKGENAIARMQTAQTQESFDEALNDFKNVIKGGMMRAQAKARSAGGGGQPAAPQAPAGGVVDYRTYFGGN